MLVAITASNVAVGVAALAVLGVTVAFAISVFQDPGAESQRVLLMGAFALALVLDQVDDGSTGSVVLVPCFIYLLAPFLRETVKPRPGDEDIEKPSG